MPGIRTKVLYAALAFALASGGWAWHETKAKYRAEGRAEVAEAAVDSLTDAVEVERQRVRVASVRVDSVRETSDSIIAAAYARIAEVEARRPALVDSVIVEAGVDSTVVRQAVERVSASYELQISDLQRATTAAEATMAVQDSLIAAMRAESVVKDRLIANLRTQLEATRSARPGWLSRNVGRGGLVALGLVGGFVAAEVVR